MKKTIKNIAYLFVLVGLLSGVGHINFMMWEFYVICIPLILLVEWKSN